MKINIVSPGRFHVLDLARELDKNGFDVKYYSFVPTKRAVSFGLPKRCSSSLFYLMLPWLALAKLFGGQQWTYQLRVWIQDRITALMMRKCDVLIAMSGEFIVTPQKAKKYGAKIIIERGSKHILEQKRILESIPSLLGKKTVPDSNVNRELQCYEIADYVSVASEHVKRSFLKHGYPLTKLFINPYGVDLSMFKNLNIKKKYDVIFVGAWSYQKGCDLILPAINDLKIQFLHVGSIVDVPFIENQFCHHHEPVNQADLVNFYNQSKVFILPSRQEGLAMVQAQALACNLPVIGSLDSGAEDLKRLLSNTDYISIITNYTSEEIKNAILKQLQGLDNLSHISNKELKKLSWEEYGIRYSKFLKEIIGNYVGSN